MRAWPIIWPRTREVAVIVGPRGADVSDDGADLAKFGQVDKAKALRQRRRQSSRAAQTRRGKAASVERGVECSDVPRRCMMCTYLVRALDIGLVEARRIRPERPIKTQHHLRVCKKNSASVQGSMDRLELSGGVRTLLSTPNPSLSIAFSLGRLSRGLNDTAD